MFTIITLNSFLDRLLTSTSLSCSSVVLPYSFVWNIFFCFSFCHLTFCVCGLFFPQVAGLYFLLLLPVGICLLLGEAGLEAYAGLMVGVPCAYPLVGGAGSCSFGMQCQGKSMFRDSSGLRRFWAACLLMTGAVFLPCWLFGLRHPNTGAYSLLSGARSGWQRAASRRADVSEYFTQYFHHQYPCPYSEPQLPLPSGAPLRPAGRSDPGSYEVIASSLGPICSNETLIAPSKCGVSLSPSPVAFLWSSLTDILSQMLQGFLIPVTDPQAGKTDVGLQGCHCCGENICDIIIFQIEGHPPQWLSW